MKNPLKKPGRPAVRPEKFPEQARRMESVVSYLMETGQIRGREDLTKQLEIDPKTLTNWITGQIEIDVKVKYSFAYLFKIKIEYWGMPTGTPIEKYIEHTGGKDVAVEGKIKKEDLEELQRRLMSETDEWARARLGAVGKEQLPIHGLYSVHKRNKNQ